MRKFLSIATLCGDGLRPELQALFDRLAIDPRPEFFIRDDGMVQAGPDPASETALTNVVPLRADRPASVPPAVADALAAGWWGKRPGAWANAKHGIQRTAEDKRRAEGVSS
jgi:hypothetical protein